MIQNQIFLLSDNDIHSTDSETVNDKALISNIREKMTVTLIVTMTIMTLVELKLLKNWNSYFNPGFSKDKFNDIETPNSSLNNLDTSLYVNSDNDHDRSDIGNTI